MLRQRGGISLKKITLNFDCEPANFTIQNRFGSQTLQVGYQSWEEVSLAKTPPEFRKVAANGAWESNNTYAFDTCFLNGPFLDTIRLSFHDDQLEGEQVHNIYFSPKNMFQLRAVRKN